MRNRVKETADGELKYHHYQQHNIGKNGLDLQANELKALNLGIRLMQQ